MNARLLTEEEAKDYLNGARPEHVCAPLRLGRRKRWDKAALDAALDKLSGIERSSDSKDAVDDWFDKQAS